MLYHHFMSCLPSCVPKDFVGKCVLPIGGVGAKGGGAAQVCLQREHFLMQSRQQTACLCRAVGTLLGLSSSCVRGCSDAQSHPTLCNSTDCSPPVSSVHGISQARILEWVAISSHRGSSWPRDWTWVSWVSCTGKRIFYHWATGHSCWSWGPTFPGGPQSVMEHAGTTRAWLFLLNMRWGTSKGKSLLQSSPLGWLRFRLICLIVWGFPCPIMFPFYLSRVLPPGKPFAILTSQHQFPNGHRTGCSKKFKQDNSIYIKE